MEEYKDILHYFCKCNAYLAKAYEDASYGACPEGEFARVAYDLNVAEKLLLEDKDRLGLKGGLSFLEDFSFDAHNPLKKQSVSASFGIKDGLFFGDKEEAYPILMKWYTSSDEEIMNNPYKYEKAVYLLSLLFWGNDEFPQVEKKGAA